MTDDVDILLAQRALVTRRLIDLSGVYAAYVKALPDAETPGERGFIESELARVKAELEECGEQVIKLDAATSTPGSKTSQ